MKQTHLVRRVSGASGMSSRVGKTSVIRSASLSGISGKRHTGKCLPLKHALPESFPLPERLSGISGISGKSIRVENQPSLSLSLSTSDFEVL